MNSSGRVEATLVTVTALLIGATPPAVVAQSALTVTWAWKRAHECSTTSPELSIAGIPAEAKTLEVKMVDLGFRDFNHGGGSVDAQGQGTTVLPSGALKDYRGPCPRRNVYFGSDYEFTVVALAADGKTVLAQGSAVRTYGRSVVKD